MTRAPLVAIGWAFATPAFNYVKRLLWLNRGELPIAGIAFERRQVDRIHGIPVVEFDEVLRSYDTEPRTPIWMTQNEALVDTASSLFAARGIPILRPAELFTALAREGRWNHLGSPFESIPLAELASDRHRPRERVFARMTDGRTRTLYVELANAFTTANLTVFFRVAERTTPDMFYATAFEADFDAGVRRFTVVAEDASLIVDILLQTPSMRHSGAIELAANPAALGGRIELYRCVLQDRLTDRLSDETDCTIAESLDEWLSIATTRTSRSLIRLRANIVDLHRLVDALDERELALSVALRQVSVDPSMLYAILKPR